MDNYLKAALSVEQLKVSYVFCRLPTNWPFPLWQEALSALACERVTTKQRCICATGVSLRFGESLQQQFFALEV